LAPTDVAHRSNCFPITQPAGVDGNASTNRITRNAICCVLFLNPCSSNCPPKRYSPLSFPPPSQSPNPNPKSKIQNPKSKIQNPKSKIQNFAFVILQPKVSIVATNGDVVAVGGGRIQNAKLEIRNATPTFPILNFEFSIFTQTRSQQMAIATPAIN
jgi:hypothetical protein